MIKTKRIMPDESVPEEISKQYPIYAGFLRNIFLQEKQMKIEPKDLPGKYRTGGLCATVTPEEIAEVLGFEANVDDDPDKVTQSWGFQCMGMDCGIWDYKGSRWSTYGPAIVFEFLFPGKVICESL